MSRVLGPVGMQSPAWPNCLEVHLVHVAPPDKAAASVAASISPPPWADKEGSRPPKLSRAQTRNTASLPDSYLWHWVLSRSSLSL
jgi:hypothetical protein